MTGRPRLLPFDKSNFDKFWATLPGLSERCLNGCCWPRFKYALSRHCGTLIPPFSHFDPFGTEFREPGRVSHPDPNRQLQRSFELAPEFLASTRQARLNGSDAYIKRDCYLFVGKSFNISQHYCFAVNAFQ